MSKSKLVFFGDFGVKDPDKLRIDTQLQSLIDEADIVGLNFEGCCHFGNIDSPNGKPIPQSVDSANWCKDHGINLFSLANNHTMDFGREGLEGTLKTFPSDIVSVGAGDWDEAYRLKVLETNGNKVGFLAATSADFSALKNRFDDKGKIGCAWVNSPSFTTSILHAKQECDYLVLIIHAGVEHLDVPLPEWREKYRSLIDLGADAVIASHPHVPQGIEDYNGKPIYYSLGNFCFDGTKAPDRYPKYWTNSLAAIIEFEDSYIKFSYIPIIRDENTLKIDESTDIKEHIGRLCSILLDDEEYEKILDAESERFFKQYSGWLLSGFNAVKTEWTIAAFKALIHNLLKKNRGGYRIALHQLREESTQYAMQRYLKKITNSYL